LPIATARRIWLYQLPPAGWGHWLLAGAIDTQIDLARSRSRQAIIAFYLAGEGVEAGFTLREHELREARAYDVPMADGARARHLQVLLAGGAELLIAEDWNTDLGVPQAA